MQDNFSTLRDSSSSGRERPWKSKKLASIRLYKSYSRLSEEYDEFSGNTTDNYFWRKRAALYNCGSTLGFAEFEGVDQDKLAYAQFCRDRLCPMCSWRKSIKDFSNLSKVIDVCSGDLQSYREVLHRAKIGRMRPDTLEGRYGNNQNWVPVFITLTVRNPSPEDLSKTLDLMFASFDRLTKLRGWKRHFKGWFRALECNYKPPYAQFAADTFHPHFHVLAFVDKSLFHDASLWSSNFAECQDIWRVLWANCLGLSVGEYRDNLQVQITPVFDRDSVTWRSSVSEVAKYTTKESDILHKDDSVTDRAVYYMSHCLRARRLIGYGGVFRLIKSALGLVDADDGGDLIITDDDSLNDEVVTAIVFYGFNAGVYDYTLLERVELLSELRLSDDDSFKVLQDIAIKRKHDEVPDFRRVKD